MSLPNWITVARIALVPVFVVFAYGDSDERALGAVVFIIASLSDFLDGYLARKWGLESRVGEFLDPLADKLLVGAALVVLVDTREFPLWAALIVAAREIYIQIFRTRIVRGGGEMPASWWGKAKTLLQIVMVSWWLLPGDVGFWHWFWLTAAITATLWSGFEYVTRTRRAERVEGAAP